MDFKFTVELCVMAMKNDTKLEEEVTCYFKINMNLTQNLTQALKKTKTFFLIGSL